VFSLDALFGRAIINPVQYLLFPLPDPIIKEGFKVCIKCDEKLPLSAFAKRGGENYLRTECKNCNRKLSRERNELKNHYGAPPPHYVCPICERQENEVAGQGGKTCTPWVVDHDHSTGKFRGWLCHRCNRAIGGFQDKAILLERAIKYLS